MGPTPAGFREPELKGLVEFLKNNDRDELWVAAKNLAGILKSNNNINRLRATEKGVFAVFAQLWDKMPAEDVAAKLDRDDDDVAGVEYMLRMIWSTFNGELCMASTIELARMILATIDGEPGDDFNLAQLKDVHSSLLPIEEVWPDLGRLTCTLGFRPDLTLSLLQEGSKILNEAMRTAPRLFFEEK